MGAGHDIAGARIGARNFGDDVVGLCVVVVEADVVVELQRRRGVGAGQAGEPAIILRRHLDAGQARRAAGAIGIAVAVDEAAVAIGDPHPGQGALLGEESVEPLGEIGAFQRAARPPGANNWVAGRCCCCRRCSSVRRRKAAVSGSEPGVGRLISTILPRSCPRQRAKSATSFIGATMMPALIVPLVGGVHVTGIERRTSGRGAVIRLRCETIDQPRPNSKPSARTLARPQSRKRCCVQRSAARICGLLVRRPPIRSVSQAAVSMTSLRLRPSSMIRLIATRSTGWAAAGSAATARTDRRKAAARRMYGDPVFCGAGLGTARRAGKCGSPHLSRSDMERSGEGKASAHGRMFPMFALAMGVAGAEAESAEADKVDTTILPDPVLRRRPERWFAGSMPGRNAPAFAGAQMRVPHANE